MSILAVGLTLAAAGNRLRAGSIIVGNALGSALMLWAMAALAAAPQDLSPDDRRLAVAAVFVLVLPVAALLASVTRLSSAVRDRRLAALRILGVNARRTRAIATAEAAVLAFAGTIVGVVLYAVAIRPAARFVDDRWAHWFSGSSFWPSWSGGFSVAIGVPALSVFVAFLPAYSVARRPLVVHRQASASRPGMWRVVPFTLGLGLLVWSVMQAPATPVRGPVVIATFGGMTLAGLGLPVAVPVGVRSLADAMVRRSRRTAVLMAGRRLQQEPATTTRLVTGLLVALFLTAGIRCVLVDWESSPQYLRAVKATTSGPQAVDVSSTQGQVNAAALRDVPGVEAVVAVQRVEIKCTASDPRNVGQAGPPSCGTAVVATCQQLKSLSPGATGCERGKPAWLIFDPPRLVPPTDRVDLVGANTDGLALSGVELRLPVRADPNDPGWADTPYDMVIPPDTPGIQALVRQQEPEWKVVLAGGGGTFERFRASAQRQGVVATSLEDTSVLNTVGRYRSGFYFVTVLVLCLGLIALLITSVDRAIEQRRHLAALAVIGVPPRVVRQSQWIQTLTPLAFGFPGAAGAGLLAGAAYLNLLGERQATPWPVVLSVTVAALVATLLVAAATTLGLGGRVRSEDLRQE